ncbi:MAG: ATP-binding protein [Actinomycetota bacterium]|nr:ATP-binding protein [Actinomycetota bacterium]
MPLNKKPLQLDSAPQSVQQARRWVADVLSGLDREDLLDAAKLGVSELVTNAILHADPPIAVRVRGTRAHPRVEVTDHSHHQPEANAHMTDEDNLLSTIGRGLGIVALYSSTWGSEVAADGKTVWFEPSPDSEDNALSSEEGLDSAQYVERRVAAIPPPTGLMTVHFLNMPVQLFARQRVRFSELGRELRLLALSHREEYPVASEISQLLPRVDQERRQAKGVEQIDEAILAGKSSVDLEYEVPMTSPETMSQLLRLLEGADEFCREQKLLALAASPQQTALQQWYLGEFVRQGRGEEPSPWHGSLTLEDGPSTW